MLKRKAVVRAGWLADLPVYGDRGPSIGTGEPEVRRYEPVEAYSEVVVSRSIRHLLRIPADQWHKWIFLKEEV